MTRRSHWAAIVRAAGALGFVMRVDRTGTVRRWEASAPTWGWTAEEAVGRDVRAIWPEAEQACCDAFRSGSPVVRAPATLARPDGSYVGADVVVAAVGHRARRGAWIVGTAAAESGDGPGLVSRSIFTETVRDALARGGRPAIVVLEASGVDAVNQIIGHAAGDELLRRLGHRLTAVLPPGAVASRYASRFAVLLPGGAEPGPAAVGTSLAGAVDGALTLGSTVVRADLHIGASCAEPGDDAASLLRHAELALVAARDSGSGAEIYDAVAHRPLEIRRERELGLRSAVDRGEFELHYQPVIDLRDHRLVGAEALIRWRRDSGEMVMPTDFIDLAESSGAILGIGLWTLHEACRQTRAWNERYRRADPLEVAVNLSVRQLGSAALTEDIAGVLQGVGIEPQRVTLEVTESSLMDDPPRMIGRLDELRSLGLTLSIDDFGTGYSSLSYLRDLPVDVLKIDRSFVGGVARTDEEWALVTAIVRLAKSLGKRTLAEGVETPAQLAHLRALGCDFAQGYLFGRPLPAAEFEDLLSAPPGD